MANITKIIAAILVLLAVLIALYAWNLGRHPTSLVKSTPAIAKLYPVVVSTKLLPAGQLIASDAVRVERLPINPEGAFKSVDDVVGQAPSVDLVAGSPILAPHMVAGLASKVAVGERAVAVRVDETNAVGNRVEPGDFVDLFLFLKRDNGEVDQSQARLLLSKLKVLAYGSSSLDGPEHAAKTEAGGTVPPRQDIARTAVLAVPVNEVNRLTLAETAGRLVLALRNPQDNEVLDDSLFAPMPPVFKVKAGDKDPLNGSTQAATGLALQGLSGAAPGEKKHTNAATPVQPSLALSSGARKPVTSGVEVIRGGKRETVMN
ncbi:Flp pilus assembly protein CpaB [Neisseriaceae bacterium JH1-16]|nr:Flp pilus assembly protein CpaB [Neisseriaceae bacterium JH1-16]